MANFDKFHLQIFYMLNNFQSENDRSFLFTLVDFGIRKYHSCSQNFLDNNEKNFYAIRLRLVQLLITCNYNL